MNWNVFPFVGRPLLFSRASGISIRMKSNDTYWVEIGIDEYSLPGWRGYVDTYPLGASGKVLCCFETGIFNHRDFAVAFEISFEKLFDVRFCGAWYCISSDILVARFPRRLFELALSKTKYFPPDKMREYSFGSVESEEKLLFSVFAEKERVILSNSTLPSEKERERERV